MASNPLGPERLQGRVPVTEKALLVIAALLAVIVLKHAEAFVVPVLAGLFLAYLLAPMVRVFERIRVPKAMGSTLAVGLFIALVAGVGGTMWGATVRVVEALPLAVHKLVNEYRSASADSGHTLGKLGAAKAAIDGIMTPSPAPQTNVPAAVSPPKGGSTARSVVVVAPTPAPPASQGALDWLVKGGATVMGSLATLFTVCLLALFILASPTDLRAKVIGLLADRPGPQQDWAQVVEEIDLAIQRYLSSLVTTNVLLGAITGWVLWMLNAQDAFVWGLLSALLHFIPYVGPILTAVGVLLSEFGATGQLQSAIVASGATILVAVVIGNFLQTWALGKVAHINTALLFVAMLFFTWLWGAIGLLLSVPLTVILKVVCDRSTALRRIGQFLDG